MDRDYTTLTDRELDVLALLSEGFTNKQIAERIYLAPTTVSSHINNIYQKISDYHPESKAKRVVAARWYFENFLRGDKQ